MLNPFKLFDLARPAIFALDPEKGHRLAINALKTVPVAASRANDATNSMLQTEVAGLTFPNPVGVAAGFDKDAEVPDALLALGFGFTEVGSITPRPQAGNPKPRLFRLTEDQAVINRMGFNNAGAEVALERLKARKARGGIVGINIGANKDSEDRIADYAHMARAMTPYASYLAVNVSSPNTPGLRALQDEGALSALIDGVIAARAEAAGEHVPPVFLKVAPDLEPQDVDAISRIAIDKGLGALIVSNTTISRDGLTSRHAGEVGGLSGEPLRALALQRLRDFRKSTGGEIALVGVGGISTAQHAWDRIKAGASLVQLYSAMVYHGPTLGEQIAQGLVEIMKREGVTSIAEAVGSE
ncbi:quinone-dependent dihydroorotate dehydrogenase [Erythrobacter sp. SCSIO 43205]|uniref:quinone-dependent dihydroorotate dehydrogenase n=1 Tax=Erythrobacter sp. SCSIO 43205 TaxID=2779361 RepID=UPI001CA8AD0E|nr:quinone-dependent dihydroorotate dehydrogenase [Erythrobacter sp. SCSIO 43205]UAB79589.1 quinone-dependent dihydroorotate dehydrogenase [Erythrobacter sp. SCSIO 43205]